jgi:hypothetical protein
LRQFLGMKTSFALCSSTKPSQIIREVHPLLKVGTTQLDEYRSYACRVKKLSEKSQDNYSSGDSLIGKVT